MEETNSEIFLRTCTKHEDIGSKHSPRGNKDSCKVQKRSPSCAALHDLILLNDHSRGSSHGEPSKIDFVFVLRFCTHIDYPFLKPCTYVSSAHPLINK